jgi:hypothetical protein
VRTDKDIEALGDEAWILSVANSNGDEATYHWRRGNLVIEAHVQCFGSCPVGTGAAAGEWADAIDARARGLSAQG